MRFTMAVTLAVSLGAALPAAAFDLTGHWEGSWSCSEFDGAKGKFSSRNSTIAMSSFGNGTLAIRLDGEPWLGIQIPDDNNSDRGEIALASCSTGADLTASPGTEIARFKVSTSGARGSLSGTSIYHALGARIATCTYRLTRVDTVDPGLGYSC